MRTYSDRHSHTKNISNATPREHKPNSTPAQLWTPLPVYWPWITTCYTYYVLRICICICSRQWQQQQQQRQQNCSWWPSDTAQTLSRIRGAADDAVERAQSTAKVKGTAINNNYNKYSNNNNYSNNYNHKVRNIARSVEVATGRGAEIKSIEARKLHATRQKKQNGKASLEPRGATPLPPYPALHHPLSHYLTGLATSELNENTTQNSNNNIDKETKWNGTERLCVCVCLLVCVRVRPWP